MRMRSRSLDLVFSLVTATNRFADSAAAVFLVALLAAPLAAQPEFLAFESGPVRPLAISLDGTELYAVNTPDNSLEIFTLGEGGAVHSASVSVGMEPVAVAVNALGQAWVVNHLSDSVSVVDLVGRSVERTLLVGDEPRDIVFAGTGGTRAFITSARRGQHRSDPSLAAVPGAGDPLLTTEGVGRADVWVFDAENLGDTLGGTPIQIVELFGDTPRGLAVSPSGDLVYAAIFHSGNQTTSIPEDVVCDGFQPFTPCTLFGLEMPGGVPGPGTNHEGENAPEVGLIVKYDEASGEWRDELARDWSNVVRFDLPDRDVFAIDANSLLEVDSVSGVGTILFNMAVHPTSGKVYVSNTESPNDVRFEGPGEFGGTTVQGHLSEARITVLDGANVDPRHLNKHLDYSLLATDPGFDPTAKEHSLATPVEMVISSDGATLYVAAFGSSKIGVFDTAELENDTFDPTVASADYLTVSGGGPGGLVLDEERGRLYVATRFDNSLAVIDLDTGVEQAHLPLHNPEPPQVLLGRPLLYDAAFTSANGEASCASCHIFADMDGLAWDLGNPDEVVTKNPIPIKLGIGTPSDINGTGRVDDFHPMKGPMTTQTLRGMANHGAMHWRGDRATPNGGDPFDENNSFVNFNVAFEGLVGRDSQLSGPQMQDFADFALAIVQPPNPIRQLDNSLTGSEAGGSDFYSGTRRADGLPILPDLGFTCEGCHTLDPAEGFFGTNGDASFENLDQIVKIAQLRNMYQKVGKFGQPETDFTNPGGNEHLGEQVRGFGYLHDGSIDTLFRFFQSTVFNPNLGVGFDGGDPQRRDMEAFMLAFPSDLAPIVGQQVTIDATNESATRPRLDLFQVRANVPFPSKLLGPGATECDLIAKGVLDGLPKGWLYLPGGNDFAADDGTTIDIDALVELAVTEAPITFTCAPPGSGPRMGLDRDGDSIPDGLDNCSALTNLDQADSDGDGRGDPCDNCRFLRNFDQVDSDADGLGDACEPRGVFVPVPGGRLPLLGPILALP